MVGLTCWPGAIGAITGAADDVARASLEDLVEREVLRRAKTTSVAGQTEYAFRHVLVRDVAYGRIPRADRARKHREIAGWLETALGAGAADREERLAYHYTEAHDLAAAAGDPMAAAMAEQAVSHLLAASTRAVGLDPARSLTHARRALSLMAADDPRRPHTLVRAGRAALASARFDEADDDLRAAIDLFALHDDEIGAADATVMLARSRFERGDIEGEGPLLQQAIAVLEAHPPGPALAHAASRMAGHLWVVGDLEACVTWSERALTLAREMGLFSEQVLAMQYRGASRSKLGDEGGSRRHARGAAHRRRARPRRGDRRRLQQLRLRALVPAGGGGIAAGVGGDGGVLRGAGPGHLVRLGPRGLARAPVRRRRMGPRARHRGVAARLGRRARRRDAARDRWRSSSRGG